MKKHRTNHILAGATASARKKYYEIKSKTVNVVEEVDRIHLAPYEGMVVKFSGELTGGNYEKPTVMLANVSICSKGVDHIWVLLGAEDRSKLAMIGRGKRVRIYLEGTIRKYVSSSGNSRYVKYGIHNARLITSN